VVVTIPLMKDDFLDGKIVNFQDKFVLENNIDGYHYANGKLIKKIIHPTFYPAAYDGDKKFTANMIIGHSCLIAKLLGEKSLECDRKINSNPIARRDCQIEVRNEK